MSHSTDLTTRERESYTLISPQFKPVEAALNLPNTTEAETLARHNTIKAELDQLQTIENKCRTLRDTSTETRNQRALQYIHQLLTSVENFSTNNDARSSPTVSQLFQTATRTTYTFIMGSPRELPVSTVLAPKAMPGQPEYSEYEMVGVMARRRKAWDNVRIVKAITRITGALSGAGGVDGSLAPVDEGKAMIRGFHQDMIELYGTIAAELVALPTISQMGQEIFLSRGQ